MAVMRVGRLLHATSVAFLQGNRQVRDPVTVTMPVVPFEIYKRTAAWYREQRLGRCDQNVGLRGFRGRHDQLEHRQPGGVLRQRAFGPNGPVPDGGEHALIGSDVRKWSHCSVGKA